MSEETEWDTSKENFVPVKQGRPTSALVTPLSVRKQDQELDEAKREFLAEIHAAEDPLPAWLKYIKWTQDQYSTQASRKELTQVLEAATKALSSLKRYNDDVRLLRLWVQYADCLPDPSSVFLFLEDHNIGRDHALFYEAYAAYLELKGNFNHADLVYQEGVKRLAKPLERLKQKHAAFMQRMAKRRERQESEAALGMGPAAADPAVARSTLAPLVPLDATPQLDENGRPIQQPRLGRSAVPQQQQAASVALGVRPAPLAPPSRSSGRSSSRGTAGAGAASLWAPVIGSAGGSSQQQRGNALLLNRLGLPGAPSSSSSSNAAPRQLEVHVDEEFGPKGQGLIPTAFPPSLQQHAQLPGVAVATKENSSQPAAWAGTKLKQQGVFVSGPVSNKLEVFDDEDSDGEGGSSGADAAAAPAQQQEPDGLRRQLDAPLAPTVAGACAGAGASKADRLAAALAPGSAQQQQPAPAAAAAPSESSQQPPQHGSTASRHSSSSGKAAPSASVGAPAAGGPQGYCEALLVGPDGQEQSFEEVRATAWLKAQAAKQQQWQQLQQQQQQRQRAAAAAASPPARPLVAQEAAPAEAAAGAATRAMSKQVGSSSSSTGRPFGAAGPVAAFASGASEVQGQHSSSVPAAPAAAAVTAGDGNGKTGHTSHTSGSNNSSRRPFASAATERATGESAPVPAAAAATGDDSGVTLNTRAAFDAMNGMFGGGDDITTMHGFGRPAAAPTAAAAAAAGQRAIAAADAGGVTMNTCAAFDAMNGMFDGGDDTTTMHGFGKQATAAARRSVTAADAGAVTMNTRAAFDAMNGMFGGYDDTTTMHGFGRPAAAAAERRAVAAADAGGVTMNTRAAFDAMNGMFGGGDETTTMHAFGRAAAAAGVGMEPTVTVNTRAAFDYMNGVFGGQGDVTVGQTAATAGRKAARKTSRFSMAPAAATAAGSNSSSNAPGTALGIYEDTELINPMAGSAQNPGNQGAAFGVYEDTEFVGAKMAGSAAGSSGRGGLAAMQGGSDGPGSSGFGLYEDTEFITRPVGSSASGSSGRPSMAAPGGGLGLYEDTDFIARPTGAGRQGRRESLAPPAGLGLYEDTDFITPPVGDSRGSTAAAGVGSSAGGYGSSGLSLYEDTEFITRPVGSAAAAAAGTSAQPEGGLGLYEDTEFITRTVPPAAAAASGSGNGSSTMLLSKVNRLSLANDALYRGQAGQRQGARVLQDGENAAPAAAAAAAGGGGLGLYEDTEFLGDAGQPGSSSGRGTGGFEVYADTEFLTKPVSAATAASGIQAGPGQQADSQPGYSSSGGDENGPAVGDSSRRHHHHQQQQQQQEGWPQGTAAAGAVLASVGPVGSSGSGSSILQQHPHSYGGAGPSRFGPGSVPNSPGASRPGTAANTPGRPPRTPGTPGTGLGPLARHMDSFEVMESPAVREALAGRPPCPGTAGNSPASLASSPGFGARENLPGPALDGKEGQRVLQPRSMADRAARAVALQPISASRAELLGVQVDPHAVAEGEDVDSDVDQQQQQQQRGMIRQSPGKALRSLQFGRTADSSIGAPARKH